MAHREVFRFGEFTLDVGDRRLLRGGEPVRLAPKAHDMLVALVRQRGRLVTKDELLARVWPEAFVEEESLTVHVSALRKALGDGKRDPGFIETVSGSGYRFTATVAGDSTNDERAPMHAAPRPVELYGRVHPYRQTPALHDPYSFAHRRVEAPGSGKFHRLSSERPASSGLRVLQQNLTCLRISNRLKRAVWP
jgi:DNA-binding winged helix-turn-helix (wHTH) protein